MLPGGQPRYASTAANDTPWPRVAECSRMRRSSIVALAAALLPALIDGQGASSMHPIDFDGDGDIDIVKSSPIGIVWLENHGVRAGAPEKKHASPARFQSGGCLGAAAWRPARILTGLRTGRQGVGDAHY